eukprot:CAMPEP_0171271224 /NCGR_PEP_ID=MMETSP0790-20130122/61120_1 /TAXON_ID=2925 /ORGANISM="Alexandrium catenella, Strain OF101" /LENGTH=85 /DNA_ID=CAMNT_0011740097 /DNA_START=45 /DNA_END=299 /DNA_ORIENTATION=-
MWGSLASMLAPTCHTGIRTHVCGLDSACSPSGPGFASTNSSECNRSTSGCPEGPGQTCPSSAPRSSTQPTDSTAAPGAAMAACSD